MLHKRLLLVCALAASSVLSAPIYARQDLTAAVQPEDFVEPGTSVAAPGNVAATVQPEDFIEPDVVAAVQPEDFVEPDIVDAVDTTGEEEIIGEGDSIPDPDDVLAVAKQAAEDAAAAAAAELPDEEIVGEDDSITKPDDLAAEAKQAAEDAAAALGDEEIVGEDDSTTDNDDLLAAEAKKAAEDAAAAAQAALNPPKATCDVQGLSSALGAVSEQAGVIRGIGTFTGQPDPVRRTSEKRDKFEQLVEAATDAAAAVKTGNFAPAKVKVTEVDRLLEALVSDVVAAAQLTDADLEMLARVANAVDKASAC
ncbi:hypothetical protein MIND_01333000 [Mycena indigotica]|uniref:Uncharacterized protein n=1 Tax=Mycena indigotica TaxID=2126181 RepID=A0A8H6S043_9AGAR|nr:uncharacterized protein MIND_01333000 [Mycena indigotica]KAF7290196.1 hypothetical protein MIND_01333000 [Mycena indigotica]